MDENERLYPKALPPRVLRGIEDPLLEQRAKLFWLLVVFPLVFTLVVAGLAYAIRAIF